MLAIGHLVARENSRLGDGALGRTMTALWRRRRSSSLHQAGSPRARSLWAGVVTLEMLVLLQAWKRHGGAWRLALAVLAAAAAPLVGPGGYAAGAAGTMFLMAHDPNRGPPRFTTILPFAATILIALVSSAFDDRLAVPSNHELSISQAMAEVLVFNNLGLDLAITPVQGSVLVLALAVVWGWSRFRGGTIRDVSPLEYAGATLAIAGFFLVTRGTMPNVVQISQSFEVIPQIGAVLFAAGWWTALRREQRVRTGPVVLSPPTRREALAVLALWFLLCVAEAPRFRRIGQARVYPVSAAEAKMFPTPTLQWWRTKFLAEILAVRQEEFLKRLDQAERRCRAQGLARVALRQAFGKLAGPGLPSGTVDTIDWLNLPETGEPADPAAVRAAFVSLVSEPLDPRPDWLPPGAPWPPPETPR